MYCTVVICVMLLFVLFYVSFVCKCVLYHCHRVFTQLQLTNISYIYIYIYYIILLYQVFSYMFRFTLKPYQASHKKKIKFNTCNIKIYKTIIEVSILLHQFIFSNVEIAI